MEEALNERLLEKLKSFLTPSITDRTEILRMVAFRLYSRASSHDKQIREKTLFQIRKKKDNMLQVLLSLLETVYDPVSVCHMAGIIRECISPKAGIARFSVIRQLIELKASQTLIKLLMQHSMDEILITDPFLYELIWILSQLSQKDPKFAYRIRQLNALPTLHLYLKLFYQHKSKLLIPLLIMIKAIAKNNNLSSILIKDSITSTVEKIFFGITFTPSSKLKLLLNIFAYLSKNANFCNRIIKSGTVPIFLKIFSRWDKYDGKARLKICNDTVVTLQHICVSKQGRSAIRKENGFAPLYKFCLTCPEDKVYDRLLAKVCSIINVCLQKKELPLNSIASPAHFPLPVELKKDYFDDVDSDDSENDGEDMDDYLDDSQNEDDFDGSPKTLRDCTNFRNEEKSHLETPVRMLTRNIADLQVYRKMFAEYYFFFYHGKQDINPAAFLDGKQTFESAGEDRNEIDGCINFDESSTLKIPIFCEIDDTIMTQRSIYCKIASRVRHILPFVKVAYPDLMGGDGIGLLQPFYIRDRKVCRSDHALCASIDALNVHSHQSRYFKRTFQKRSKLVAGVDRCITDEKIYNNTVYDLDKLLLSTADDRVCKKLINNDETRLGIKEYVTSTLNFESRFESGNLRKAIQVGSREYDLILTPDVNSSHHCQWFYFEVSNMDNMAPYTFNLINCEKTNSQFNYGMKPIVYSVREATLGRQGWFRAGTDICYYRNGYKIPHANKQTFLTASFSIKFPHSLDVCYIAYTFPYTYSQLLSRIRNWSKNADRKSLYFRIDSLCDSLNENSIPLLTITAPDTKENRIADREIVFLTSRVHPGEANSSWVIDGCISHLLNMNSGAEKLRSQYVFKIVPMLNVEGVINGCHRCGLTDEDLNRKWSHPDRQLHPSIFHTKGLLEYCTRILRRTPFIFCDFHGHSRRKNVFFFGCSNQESWLEADRNIPNVGIEHQLLPHVMENCSPAFSSELCTYKVERNRESTARVTVWREFGVKRSYTMETSYCGCDQGPYKGFHLDTVHLQEIGSNFCTALACLYDERKWRIEMLLAKQDGNRYIYSSSSQVGNCYLPTKLGLSVNSQSKTIHPPSLAWNLRKTASTQKKITPLQTPIRINSD